MKQSAIITTAWGDIDLNRVQGVSHVNRSVQAPPFNYEVVMVSGVSLPINDDEHPREDFVKAWREVRDQK